MRRRAVTLAVTLAVGLVVAGALPGGPAAAQDPSVAPTGSYSDGGRQVSAAGMVLRASQVADLDPAGQVVAVDGSGFDEQKGIYVSFCVIPPPNHPPTPCGGGQDRGGTSGASTWISSNPPSYAAGLTTPYGPGGSFAVSVAISPVIADGIDCRIVRCAIVTRNDHTRSSDRSQDLFLPVTFRAAGGPPATAAPATLPPTTTTTTTPSPAAVAPAVTASADGRTVSDGLRSLTVSDVDDLDPAGAAVTVTGIGFDGGQGIYVALCRVPSPGEAPGPCAAGAGRSAWISSNPPEYGRDLAVPFAPAGRFEVVLELAAEIDAATDCRAVACAVVTRSDDSAPGDRRNDLLVPVAFAEAAPATSTTAPDDDRRVAAVRPDADDEGRSPAVVALGGAAVTGAAVVVLLLARSRRRRTAAAPGAE